MTGRNATRRIRDPLERMLSNICSGYGSGCWIWTGPRMKNGYGVTSIRSVRFLAHRAFYTLMRGPIPAGLHIDHLCRNRLCVNPDHLEAVTQKENTLRGVAPNVQTHVTGLCKRGHDQGSYGVMQSDDRTRCGACQRLKEHGTTERLTAHYNHETNVLGVCARGHAMSRHGVTEGDGRRRCRVCRADAQRLRAKGSEVKT